jgi:hypothetical protein
MYLGICGGFNVEERVGLALVQARSAYDYPFARLVREGEAEPDLQCGDWTWWFDPPGGRTTERCLDEEFTSLLRSDAPRDQVQGVLGVIYWGFITYSDEFARARASRLCDDSVCDVIGGPIQRARQALDDGLAGRALGHVAAIPGLSRTPFASKVVAFLAPQLAGVFDNQIYEFCARLALNGGGAPVGAWLADNAAGWAWTAFGGLREGKARRERVERGYARWCEFLSDAARALNNMGLRWATPADPDQVWRAVDVERAIFQCSRGAGD